MFPFVVDMRFFVYFSVVDFIGDREEEDVSVDIRDWCEVFWKLFEGINQLKLPHFNFTMESKSKQN